MLSIYQKCFKKAMIERIYRVKFFDKCKMGFRGNFRRSWSTKKIYRMNTITFFFFFFFGILFASGFFVSNAFRKVVDLTTLNILRTTRAMLLNFCIVNTPKGQILICGCKIFCLLQQIFACGKVKG